MKKIKKSYLLICVIIIIIPLLSGFYFLSSPSVHLSQPYYLEIFDDNKEKVFSYNHGYDGEYTPLNEISECFINTLITIEDKNFYKHNGFDYLRITKSIFSNIKTNSFNQGASTITQQLARTIYLSNEKSISRKINEAILARKIEKKYHKEYILELYINSVYFAHNLYGIGAASEYYFRKKPKDLNYQESCLLVGVINAPNIYSPFINLQASLSKQKNIAFQLLKNNIIDANEYFNILQYKSPLYGPYQKDILLENYYSQGLIQEIKNNKTINNEKTGLLVQSHFNKEAQNIIKSTIKRYSCEDEISVIIMKPYSGKIIALSGGKDFNESQYNRALYAKRAIGSTIKPLLYYIGLNKGLTPLSKFTSKPTNFKLADGSYYSPHNSNNIYANKKINMVEAIAMSDNIYAVKTAIFIGLDNLKSLLNRFNVKLDNINLTASLGNVEMTPLELISIYNTFASEGVYYKPTFIKNIKNADGVTLYTSSVSGKQLLNYEECLMINYLLQSPFDNALTSYSTPTMRNYQVNNLFCTKTGTTDSSNWTVGFNQDYTVLVYVGNDNNEKIKDATLSRKVWRDIVNSLTLNTNNRFYSYPQSLHAFQFYNSEYNTYSKIYLKKH